TTSVSGRTRRSRQRQASRALPAPRPTDHDTGAVAQPAAAADTRTALAPPRNNTTCQSPRSGVARQPARVALDRPPGAATDRRGTRARTVDRNDHPQTRTTPARTTRRRTARRRTTRPILVSPRTHHLRSSLRPAR